MATKRQRAKKEISLSSKEEKNYKSDTKIKQILTKSAMTKTYHNSEKGGLRKAMSN